MEGAEISRVFLLHKKPDFTPIDYYLGRELKVMTM
jgi:hypothetical protein